MKSFFKIVLSSLLLLTVGVTVIEFLYRDYKTSIDHRFDLYHKTDNVKVLLNGNSHTGCLGTPDINGLKSFNFSIGGQDIFHIYITLKTAIQNKDHQIEKVIIGIDYDLFGYDYKIANTMWLDRNYYNSTGVLYDSSLANYFMAHSGFFQANREFSYLKDKLLKSKQENNKKTELNFVPQKGHAKDRAIEHSFQKYDTSLIEMNTMYLEKTILLAKGKNIQLVMVNLPKKEVYYQNYNEEARKKGKEILEKYSAKYEIPFIDFWKDDSLQMKIF